MTPNRHLRKLILLTGLPRRQLALMLGYTSHSSLHQAETGRAHLPAGKLAWLENYARWREKQAKAEQAWLQKNPCPPD